MELNDFYLIINYIFKLDYYIRYILCSNNKNKNVDYLIIIYLTFELIQIKILNFSINKQTNKSII